MPSFLVTTVLSILSKIPIAKSFLGKLFFGLDGGLLVNHLQSSSSMTKNTGPLQVWIAPHPLHQFIFVVWADNAALLQIASGWIQRGR